MADLKSLLRAIPIGDKVSPRRRERKVRAVFFDTYGTVCDFYGPLRRRFARFAEARGIACDAGAMAIAWRTAYAVSTFTQAATGAPFRPLREILEKVFGLIPRFKSRDELLEEEFAKFVVDLKPEEATAIPAIKTYFKAYVSNGQVRHIIDSKQFTDLATNPYLPTRDFKAVPARYRARVPEYVKDYVSLNQFAP